MTIYNAFNFLKKGHTALDYYRQYKKNKAHCGRHKFVFPKEPQVYITEKVAQGWTLDVIIGRQVIPIACSMPTLYRRFKGKVFDETTLPMKRKGNHMALSNVGENLTSSGISMRENDYPAFKEEFGHVEGDTIV